MVYDANDKKTILYRLGYLLPTACFGFLPILVARDMIANPWPLTNKLSSLQDEGYKPTFP